MSELGAIIECVRTVARYNSNMASLKTRLEGFEPIMDALSTTVADAKGLGFTVFEGLSQSAPPLADAIHDFVYQVSHPHASLITKNIAREEVAKSILGLV